MKVKIYHSIERGFRFEPWVPEAPLKLVDEYTVQGWRQGEHPDSQVAPGVQRLAFREGDPVVLILEAIYRDQNSVDGSERNVRMRNRSLSTGDVIVLDDKAYAVDRDGWQDVELEDLNIVTEGPQLPRIEVIPSPIGRYVSEDDAWKFDRLLSDPFGRS